MLRKTNSVLYHLIRYLNMFKNMSFNLFRIYSRPSILPLKSTSPYLGEFNDNFIAFYSQVGGGGFLLYSRFEVELLN